MKLLDHLLLHVLDYVEGHETPGPYEVPTIDGFSPEQIQYHIRMCEEAEWLREGKKMTGKGHPKYTHVGELTWEGHTHLRKYKGIQ